jgi:hypothetical protein
LSSIDPFIRLVATRLDEIHNQEHYQIPTLNLFDQIKQNDGMTEVVGDQPPNHLL